MMEKMEPTGRRARAVSPALLLVLVAASATAAEPWETVCAEEAAIPEIKRVVAPVPHPGKWRGKAFGDKKKHDVEIEECGRTIQGMARVSFVKGIVGKSVLLERDEDDGHYRAKFVWAESGAAVVVTWDLEAESESRMTGGMTVIGRHSQVTAELLEAEPNPELAICECDAVGSRREVLASQLTDRRNAVPTAQDGATSAWKTDPNTCSILSGELAPTLPTQASFEVVARAGWQGEVVHRERCCAVHRAASPDSDAPTTYSEWIGAAPEEHASDEIAALTAEVGALDAWLLARCAQDEE
jgi:hypothetical protein